MLDKVRQIVAILRHPFACMGRWLSLTVRRVLLFLNTLMQALWLELEPWLAIFAAVTVSGIAGTYVVRLARDPNPWHLLFWTAAISACAVLIFYYIRRSHYGEPWREHNRRLNAPCRADNDPYTAAVEMQGGSKHDDQNFLRAFKEVPQKVENVLLILPQTGKHFWDRFFPYTFESIRRQLLAREEDATARAKTIKWVCFVDFNWTFVAYQSFAKFETEVLRKGNTEYSRILNLKSAVKFRQAVADHRTAEADLKNGKPAPSNTIPGLEIGAVPDHLTRRHVIAHLRKHGAGETMLVSRHDRKPIGIVTLSKLLCDVLKDEFFSEAQLSELESGLADWDLECAARTKPFETDDSGPHPGDTGDDSPERDAMVPGDGGLLAKIPADLRFTRP